MNSTSTPSMAAIVVGGRDRGRGLDLDDAEDLVVGPVQRAGVEPEPAGPVVGGDPAVPGGG